MPDQISQHSADELIAHWLTQYCGRIGLDWGQPPYSLCVKICRVAFQATDGMDEIERCLMSLLAQRKRPKDWEWFYWRIKDWLEDAAHAKRPRSGTGS